MSRLDPPLGDRERDLSASAVGPAVSRSDRMFGGRSHWGKSDQGAPVQQARAPVIPLFRMSSMAAPRAERDGPPAIRPPPSQGGPQVSTSAPTRGGVTDRNDD